MKESKRTEDEILADLRESRALIAAAHPLAPGVPEGDPRHQQFHDAHVSHEKLEAEFRAVRGWGPDVQLYY
jgi:hypothetical protein